MESCLSLEIFFTLCQSLAVRRGGGLGTRPSFSARERGGGASSSTRSLSLSLVTAATLVFFCLPAPLPVVCSGVCAAVFRPGESESCRERWFWRAAAVKLVLIAGAPLILYVNRHTYTHLESERERELCNTLLFIFLFTFSRLFRAVRGCKC